MKRCAWASWCVIFFLTPVWSQTAEQKKQTIDYLRALQTEGGGFAPAKTGTDAGGEVTPSLRATTAALRALKYFGGEPRDKKACAEFVERCYHKKSGGFTDQLAGTTKQQPDVITTAVGIMAVVELKMPWEPYQDALAFLSDHAKEFEEVRMAAAGLEAVNQRSPRTEAWLHQIDALRHRDGSFGQGDGAARATGGAVAAILRLGGKLTQREQALQTIRAGQRPDGGFGKEGSKTSDLETSYRVMRALHMLKEKPADSRKFKEFVAGCRNKDGGYGAAAGQPSSAGGTYFAAIILHWLAE